MGNIVGEQTAWLKQNGCCTLRGSGQNLTAGHSPGKTLPYIFNQDVYCLCVAVASVK